MFAKIMADEPIQMDSEEGSRTLFAAATGFLYNGQVDTLEGGIHQFLTEVDRSKSLEGLLADNTFKIKAKHPLQFMRNCDAISRQDIGRIPITQDASASAYQIMSYLLNNLDLAKKTNLIPDPNSEGKILIQDLYTHLLNEFIVFVVNAVKGFLPRGFPKDKRDNLSKVISSIRESENDFLRNVDTFLNRKVIKGIFMPKVYGKTEHSITDSLRKAGFTSSDNSLVSELISLFWEWKFGDINNLMVLFQAIASFLSSLGREIRYRTPYFTTIQDYMDYKREIVSVYEGRQHKGKKSKQRRQISLNISSEDKRDTNKASSSTFANFIHQKDAFIAMKVVEKFSNMKSDEEGIPIYSVHDNFISTLGFHQTLPKLYIEVFTEELDDPLTIINEFIYMNVIPPLYGSR